MNNGHGAASWLLTKDHKRIALLYLVSITGLLRDRRRLRHAGPARAADAGRRPARVGDLQQDVHHARRGDGLLLPDPVDSRGAGQLPAPDHGRRQGPGLSAINLLSWYIYVLGGAFTLYAALSGGVDTGWTFYTPYSTAAANSHVMTAALGVFITGFSSILTGLNFIVTVHRMRAPG